MTNGSSDKLTVDVDTGFKMAVEVLLPLNHDRYKVYFTQFIVVHFGLFTLMKTDVLEGVSYKISSLCIVGMFFSFLWFLTLHKIYADISNLWKLIKDYEKKHPRLEFKISKSGVEPNKCKLLFHSGIVMMFIPILIGLVYLGIMIFYKQAV